MAQITYNDKVALNVNSNIADINKVNASDMNEIKASVNNNDDMLNGNAVAGDMVVNSIRTKNMLDSSTLVEGDIISGTPTLRMSSRQALWLKAGTYTFSTNMTNSYNYSLTTNTVGSPPLSSYPTYDLNTSWQSSSTYTFTLTSSGWFVLALRRSDNGTFTSADIINLKDFNYQLEKGSTATAYKPYQNLNPDMKPIISTCDYDTNVFGSPYVNKLIRTGNVVEITFLAPVIVQPSGNTNIINNLPGFAKGTDTPILSFVGTDRYIPNSSSTVKQLWTFAPSSIRTGKDLLVVGNWLYFNFIYITNG